MVLTLRLSGTRRICENMSIEQKINYQLNKYPTIKKVIKRTYQTGMYAISKKIKSEGDITRISPDDHSHEYFFGYYDKSPWDYTDRYMLCMRANNTWTDVSPRETADILIIDTQKDITDPQRVKKIAETHAWNVQQGCMAQWLGPDFSSKVLYNDYRDGKYVSVILTLETMEERVIPVAVYSVSGDGKLALTLDFSRLYNLRPGYGYYNVPEETKGIDLPDATAIWKVNLETGEVTDLLSYADFANFQPRDEMKVDGVIHKVNHIMLSPNGKRFMVLYRWFCGQRKYTRLITCNSDGTDMYVLSDDDMVSHCFWKNNFAILAFENKKKDGPGYYLMKDKTDKYFHCWPQFSNDGHPSYSPDGRLIVTDSYPDRARVASINIMDGDERKIENTTIAKVFAPFKYDNDTRCDLHPRWNRAGNKVCFDSVFEGHRGLYYVDVNTLCKSQKADQSEYSQLYEENILISIIVPVYNVEQYLERCVKSLINQTYRNLQIILVDDGSTDNSGLLCDQLGKTDARIVVIHKKNGGLSSARNAGLDICKGDCVTFVDSDDWVELDTYAYMLELMQNHQAEIADVECQYAYADKDAIKATDNHIEVFYGQDVLWNYFDRGLRLKNSAPYTVWRKLYRKDVIGLCRFPEGKNSEDLQFNYEVLKKSNSIVLSNVVKYHYFQNESGISIGKLKKSDMALIDICADICEKEKNNSYKNIKELTQMKLARSYFSLLARIAKVGYKKEDFHNINEITAQLTRGLRTNFVILMKSHIPFNRKVLICVFCIDYRLLAYPYQKLKKIKRS